MAYDEGLAERIRNTLDGERGITEKKMFGGVAVRVGPSGYPSALAKPHARPMDFTGEALDRTNDRGCNGGRYWRSRSPSRSRTTRSKTETSARWPCAL